MALIPKDAQKALESVPTMMQELKTIRELLQRLVDIEESRG